MKTGLKFLGELSLLKTIILLILTKGVPKYSKNDLFGCTSTRCVLYCIISTAVFRKVQIMSKTLPNFYFTRFLSIYTAKHKDWSKENHTFWENQSQKSGILGCKYQTKCPCKILEGWILKLHFICSPQIRSHLQKMH